MISWILREEYFDIFRAETIMPLKAGKNTDTSTLKPLKRVDLVRGVASSLRGEIISGSFGVDGFLPPEGKLGESLGVSRTVIREAMRILGAQGLVEVSQGRRPRVRPADPQTVVDTFVTFLDRSENIHLHLLEVRRPLETRIAGLAAQRATAADMQTIARSVERMAGSDDVDEQAAADVEFHELLATASANPVFEVLLKSLSGVMWRSRRQALASEGVEKALPDHRAILAAVRKGDARAAEAAMAKHLKIAEQYFRKSEF